MAEAKKTETTESKENPKIIKVAPGDSSQIEEIWDFDALGDESGRPNQDVIDSSPRTAHDKIQAEQLIKQSDALKEELSQDKDEKDAEEKAKTDVEET